MVKKEALRSRLAFGWPPERAITVGKHEQQLPTFAYDGRELTLSGWAELTGIGYHTLYARMYKRGLTFEQALERGPDQSAYREPVTAFGETKPLYWWCVDARAAVEISAMRERLDAGWNPQLAITEPPLTPGSRGHGTLHEAFGRRMTIPDWGRLAHIPHQLLRHHLAGGNGLEQVLRGLGWYPHWIDTRPAVLDTTLHELRPGDTILALHLGEDPAAAHFTVRRTSTSVPDTPGN